MNTIQVDVIYLLSCAVNSITPDIERLRNMDFDNIYLLAKQHTVRVAVCIAIERAGINHEKFHDAMKKAVRKNIFFDIEWKNIMAEFENQDIWYMPIKGAVLKNIYPENGMREMADYDVLYDINKQQAVKKIMLESVGKSNHDIYHKQPVLNFELHTSLFGEHHTPKLYNYYSDFSKYLIKDIGNNFGYHLSDEDFYIYMTAHEWKHYSKSGTGIRSLLDCYVYLMHNGDSLDWSYIEEQMKQLGISDFEEKRRELALKVFSSVTIPDLNDSETEMLLYYLTAGTYGTFENRLKKELQERSKTGYILGNMFPRMKYMRSSVEFVDHYPALYPAGILYRWGRIILKRRKNLFTIIKVVSHK